jgi:signal transduction histidine kinase
VAVEERPADETASGRAFAALSDALLAIGGERSVEPVLQRLAHAAREVAAARYAALGVPDDAGGFGRFLVSGMSDEQIAALGPLPRAHGMLGAMLEQREPFRSDDIRRDPRFGWWPSAHPQMRSFLGVPIVARGSVIGSFYLAEKIGAPRFSDGDERAIVLLAAHAAIAIENARLHERSRELSAVEERTRIARELHDSVTQTLFSIVLSSEIVATQLDRAPDVARARLADLQALAQSALGELRAAIFELRPAELERDGLVRALERHVEALRRLHDVEIAVEADGEPQLDPQAKRELLRIAQEALANALRHARARHIGVRLRGGGGALLLEVRDDGTGFDPLAARGLRPTGLGLASLEQRAHELGASLVIESAPGAGTTLRVELAQSPVAGGAGA